MAGSPARARALTIVRAMRRAWSSSLHRPDGEEQQRRTGVSKRARSRRVRQRRRALPSGSLNRIPKCFCVFANPSVPCHDHDQRRWLVNHLRCRQVHGVERTNWLDRKRSADASENRVRDTDDVTAKFETTERAHCRSLFVGRQPRGRARSKNRPCGFGNRQCGSDLPPWSADRLTKRSSHAREARRPARWTRCTAHQRFPGSKAALWLYASPRSASISSAAVPAGSPMFGHPSVGSPASSGGRITPEATSSSKRLGVLFAVAPGWTSSATTRP